MEEKGLVVKSSIWMGALNAALVMLTYFFVLVLGFWYLKYFQGIDLVEIFVSAFSRDIPFVAEIVDFLSFLFENVLTDTLIAAMIYAAYLANYEIRVDSENMNIKKGFLMIKKEEFAIEDIEQVFTENYTFFPGTKQLCIKALDEDLIRIPYVRKAERIKKQIISLVREKHSHIELDSELKKPIKVMSWQPS